MTTQQAQHTPGPWLREGLLIYALHPLEGEYRHGKPVLVNRFSARIDPCLNQGGALEEAEANVEFIIRACNSHDDLLAALVEMRRRHDTKAVAANFNECGCDDCVAARAAIAKATGGQP